MAKPPVNCVKCGTENAAERTRCSECGDALPLLRGGAGVRILVAVVVVFALYAAFVKFGLNEGRADSSPQQTVVALWAVKDLLVALVAVTGIGVWNASRRR